MIDSLLIDQVNEMTRLLKRFSVFFDPDFCQMNRIQQLKMLKRKQNTIYLIIFFIGLFLHLLLWDTDFLSRLSRLSEGWQGITAVSGVVWDWFRLYIIKGIGVWILMLSCLLLFVILPILSRYKHISIKPNPWLAVNVSVYFFLIMKMLRVY